MARGVSVGLLSMTCRRYVLFNDIARATGLACTWNPLRPWREREFLFIRASKLIISISSVPCASPQNVSKDSS